MTVKEFKNLVAAIPETLDGWKVVVSSDAEGNHFHELHDISHDDDENCTQYFDEQSDELNSYDEEEWDSFDDFTDLKNDYPHLQPCIVLWP